MSTSPRESKTNVKRRLLNSNENDADKEVPLKMKQRKRVKCVGLLGFPKKSRLLYFFNKKEVRI